MTRYRWVIAVILWVLYVINYFDRISVLTFLPLIQKDLGLTFGGLGLAASLFFFAYAVAQFSAGPLSDRYTPKKIMNIAIWTFTAATFLNGLVRNITQFMVIRVGLGLGEGHHWAPANRTLANWFPKHEKGRATSLLSSTAAVAPAIIPITVTWLATVLGGWRPVFFILALPGLIGVFLLMYFIHNVPQEAYEKKRLSVEELDYIKDGLVEVAPGSDNQRKFTLKEQMRIVFRDSSFWLYSAALFCELGLFWGSTTWISSFLYDQYHFSILKMGALASMPYVMGFVAMLLGGWAMDRWFKSKARPVLMISFISSVVVMLLIAHVPGGNLGLLILMLLVLGFAVNLPLGVIYAYPQVRYPKEVLGSAVGFSNGIGQFGSFVAPLIAGFLIEKTANGVIFAKAFGFFAVLGLAGLILTLLMSERNYDYLKNFRKEA